MLGPMRKPKVSLGCAGRWLAVALFASTWLAGPASAKAGLPRSCVGSGGEFAKKPYRYIAKLRLGKRKVAHLVAVTLEKGKKKRKATLYAVFAKSDFCVAVPLKRRLTSKVWDGEQAVDVWTGSHLVGGGEDSYGPLLWRRGKGAPLHTIDTGCGFNLKAFAVDVFGGKQKTLMTICYSSLSGGDYSASVQYYHRFGKGSPQQILNVSLGIGSSGDPVNKAPGWVKVRKRGPRAVLHVATTTGSAASPASGGHVGFYTWDPAQKKFKLTSKPKRFP